MKPEFALILSSDGIVLLKREADDWYRVGAASLGSSTFTNDLKDLRKVGENLIAGDINCKVVIPDDQIRYLTIETGEISPEKRLIWARQALEGATPYAVNDLAFDLSIDNTQTHIAAVARETLDEAESFAYEHGFFPTSFVASPTNHPYVGEPFFGTSQYSSGAAHTGEDKAIVETSPHPFRQNNNDDSAPDITSVATIPPAPSATPHIDSAPLSLTPDIQVYDETSAGETSASAIGFSSRRHSAAAQETQPVSSPLIGADVHDNSEIPAAPVSGPIPSPQTALQMSGTRRLPPNPALRATSAPAKAKRIAAPSALATNGIKGGKSKKSATASTARTVITAAACVTCAVAVWATASHLPSLWGDLDEADLVTPKDTVPVPVIEPVTPTQTSPSLVEDTTNASPHVITSADLPLQVTEAGTTAPAHDDPLVEELPEPHLINKLLQEYKYHTSHDAPSALKLDNSSQNDDLPSIEGLAQTKNTDATLQSIKDTTKYAATGIWQHEPKLISAPKVESLTNVTLVKATVNSLADREKIFPVTLQHNVVLATDTPPTPVSPPPAPSQVFDLDERGLVKASKTGTITPDGIMVYSGRPGSLPPAVPDRTSVQESLPLIASAPLPTEIGKRPLLRPQRATETLQPSSPSNKRPRLRPKNFQAQARAINTTLAAVIADTRIENEIISQSQQNTVVAIGTRPKARPANFANLLKASKQEQTSVVSNGAGTQPTLQSSTSVSRQATERNALNLRRLNLIGISGSSSNRRALIRLPSGRYIKVKVGDRIDGGRVIAISDNKVQYRKGNSNTTLEMPRG